MIRVVLWVPKNDPEYSKLLCNGPKMQNSVSATANLRILRKWPLMNWPNGPAVCFNGALAVRQSISLGPLATPLNGAPRKSRKHEF